MADFLLPLEDFPKNEKGKLTGIKDDISRQRWRPKTDTLYMLEIDEMLPHFANPETTDVRKARSVLAIYQLTP